jgi:hypothetical protein
MEQKELVSKIVDASQIIEKNRLSKANYISVSVEKIDSIAKELNVSREEAVAIIQEYFNPKNG